MLAEADWPRRAYAEKLWSVHNETLRTYQRTKEFPGLKTGPQILNEDARGGETKAETEQDGDGARRRRSKTDGGGARRRRVRHPSAFWSSRSKPRASASSSRPETCAARRRGACGGRGASRRRRGRDAWSARRRRGHGSSAGGR